jgi:putative NIF3 family GTP cyclohydrolase 1 type 2
MQIIKINDVHKCVTKKFPLTLQEKWDSSGVIVYRNLSEQVTGIVLCLDVNQGTVDEAIKCGANLIIAHHPVHLKSKSAKPNKYTSDLLKRIKDNHLTLIVYHTNVDNHLDGLNNFVAKELGLSGIKNIKGTSMVGGHLKFPYRPKVFASTMISKFGLERVLFVSDNLIKNVVICAGSGFDIIQEHADKLQNIDAVVTGDVC